ncbi:MAG: zinc dependent phospholipase C family protein [Oscillospiraceae bacterium]|jgi:hypothetical protein|nr:zinc dependent phospholipase C family protein [Oscillospiraceae bacterium]
MPSGYLHKRCAEEAARRAGLPIAAPEAYLLGAMGADPLFMLGIFPLRLNSRPLRYGHMVHQRRTGAFLLALLRQGRAGGAAAHGFALGFLTHYALDTTVHPYVYAHSVGSDGRYHSRIHMRLEKQWDTLFFRQDGGRGTAVTTPGIAEAQAIWPEIAAIWARATAEVFPGEALSEAMALKALQDAARANRLTHSPRGGKYALVWAAERIIGKAGLATAQMAPRFLPRGDFVNAGHRPWRNPAAPGVKRSEGLAELWEAALEKAQALLLAGDKYLSGEMAEAEMARAIGNLGYGTGVEAEA